MSQVTVKQLSAETVKLITSTQIVTSVSTAVKELVENSIDAGANIIQVRLENYGLDLIEVKDNGSGVSYDNVQRMFLPGNTSKIRQFEDLDDLHSYGFRGEALAAICKIGKVSVTTKTSSDTLAMTYDIDSTGLPLSSKPTHLNVGTIVAVSGLFSNLPVRRLFLSSKKKVSEELKKTEQVVQSLSLIHPELTVSFIHNKCPIWKKNATKGIKQSFMQVAGLKIVSKMEHLNKITNKGNIDLIIPKKNLENVDNLFTNSSHSAYVFINERPINCKNILQLVQEHIFHHFRNLNLSFKYAVCLIAIHTSPQQIDVNLEPNKTKILLKNEKDIISLIDEILSNYYENKDFICSALKNAVVDELLDEEVQYQPTKRIKLESFSLAVGEKRSEEFREKNKDWHLEIINEGCSITSNFDLIDSQEISHKAEFPQSLCSQINSTNSILSTEEVLEVNTILSETNRKLVTSANSKNSETRLVERNDIQSQNFNKPILQEWPHRPKTTIETQPSISSLESDINKAECQKPEKLAESLEKESEKINIEIIQPGSTALEQTPENSNKLEDEVGQFDLSMQSISSQMGKKEMKAFTKFARIMRPKIIEEFPNIIFTQVAGILAERWKCLTPDEVKYYEKMAEVVECNRKAHKEEKQNCEPPANLTKSANCKKSNIKLMIERMKKKSKLNRPPRKEIHLTVSFSHMKEFRMRPSSESPENDFQILGQLKPSGNWLYKKEKIIGHIRHQCLKELITFQRMLSSYSIPTKSLEKPLEVNEDNLGNEFWDVLLSLDIKYDEETLKYIIDSDVIKKNGFIVELKKGEDVFFSGRIIEVASAIPHYGISELKDTLKMYQKNGEFAGLAAWRPTSVYNFISNEAIRIAQQTPDPPTSDEMEELMNIYNLCFVHLQPVCLHSRQIFPQIYNLEEKPPVSIIT